MKHLRIVVCIILITVIGVVLFLSPLRSNTLEVVGAFAFMSALVTFLAATVDIRITSIGEDKTSMDVPTHTTQQRESSPIRALSFTFRSLNFSDTDIYSRAAGMLGVDSYSSEYQITLSSLYMPTRIIPAEQPTSPKEQKQKPKEVQ